MEGNLCFKISWASHLIYHYWLCFTLYLRAIFQVQAPGELIFGGAYMYGGLVFGILR